jgi:thiamine biosynthesis lipoprotein ApbE
LTTAYSNRILEQSTSEQSIQNDTQFKILNNVHITNIAKKSIKTITNKNNRALDLVAKHEKTIKPRSPIKKTNKTTRLPIKTLKTLAAVKSDSDQY